MKSGCGVSSIDLMEAEARFTRQHLIKEANAIRAGATDRLITDWVEIGLVDHPHKPGLGRGPVRSRERGSLRS